MIEIVCMDKASILPIYLFYLSYLGMFVSNDDSYNGKGHTAGIGRPGDFQDEQNTNKYQ